MGYFPNGTEFYESQHCTYCVNWRYDELSETFGCPIMDLHMFWNYDAVARTEIGNAKRDGLDFFIHARDDGNDQCRMFLPYDPDRCTETPDLFAETNQ